MDVDDLSGRVAVVTGAASGIGRATALELARRGADLAICDVDEAGLEETAEQIRRAGRRVLQSRIDVSNAENVRAFAERTFAELGRADVLVNNAGIAVGGFFVDIPLAEWDTILGINLKGVVNGCHFFVPKMIEAGTGGHVVNVASMAGYVASPGMTAYTATKFAVVGFSEVLRAELAERGIGVTVVCPGVINTAIVRSAKAYGFSATPENRERVIRMFERRNYGPDRVARGIVRAIQKNRAIAPIAPEAWAGYWIKRLFPWLLAALGRLSARRQARDGRGLF
jgi:NAD(P)-dependent dehydrogenase (short-subunit alcohol dehydrogenase family)